MKKIKFIVIEEPIRLVKTPILYKVKKMIANIVSLHDGNVVFDIIRTFRFMSQKFIKFSFT